jgi:hypothetical protein
MYCGPLRGANLLLLGFGNPLLMVVYLLFSFMSFIYGYLESKKEPSDSNEERDYEEGEIVFINISQSMQLDFFALGISTNYSF